MSALLSGIHDRSTVVQKQFAFALGHLVRVSSPYSSNGDVFNLFVCLSACFPFSPQTAKDSSVEKLLLKLNGWYLEKEGAV